MSEPTYKLVPVVPTPEMIAAAAVGRVLPGYVGAKEKHDNALANTYRKMVDAAPAAPAGEPVQPSEALVDAAIAIEDLIDRQTYDERRKADFDMPDDAELHVVITVGQFRALSAAIAAAQTAAAVPPPFNGWYCAQCQRGVDASEVTFHEQHTVCGRVITNDMPPAATHPPAGEQTAGASESEWVKVGGFLREQRDWGVLWSQVSPGYANDPDVVPLYRKRDGAAHPPAPAQPSEQQVFWLYELTAGEGVYQGCTGEKAEQIVRETASGFDEAGEPFPVYRALAAAPAPQERDARMLTEGERNAAIRAERLAVVDLLDEYIPPTDKPWDAVNEIRQMMKERADGKQG